MDQYIRERRPLSQLNQDSNQNIGREFSVALRQIARIAVEVLYGEQVENEENLVAAAPVPPENEPRNN
ncbi:unnamed protein product [Caenorhabditis nigoni]